MGFVIRESSIGFLGDLCWMISFICTPGGSIVWRGNMTTWISIDSLIAVVGQECEANLLRHQPSLLPVLSCCGGRLSWRSRPNFLLLFQMFPHPRCQWKVKVNKYSKINPGGYWVEGNNNKQLRITSPTPFQAQSSPLLLPPRMAQVTSRSSSVGILEVWSFEFFSIPTVEHLRWKQPTLLKAGLKPPRDHQHVVSLESWVMLGWPTWAKKQYRTNKTCMTVWLHVRWTNISQWPLGHIKKLSHRR